MSVAQPLAGVTVLDFGQVYNGPYCGFLLAQAGARVIKVESPRGETLRGRGDPNSVSQPFAMLNGGKECITLNIKSERGQQLLKQLVMHADVLVENFAPGTLTEYGVGSDELRALNPRLIYAASTGYGSIGPYRDYLGMDITLQAMSGIMSVTGADDGPPMKAGVALCDFLGGVHLYAGITSALYQREQTGLGAVLDISMQDCVFPTLTTQLGTFFQAGKQGPRTGNRQAGLSTAPYNLYQARDGHVAMICIREGHWRNLCAAMQQPDLATDPRFSKASLRTKNIDELDATIEAWTLQYDKAEIFAVAQRHGVICAPVQDLQDVVNDPHLHARGSLHWHEHESLGKTVLFSTPLRFKGSEPPPPQSVAGLGAHSDVVLAELLKLSGPEIDTLRAEGAI